mgnify:CR=1 FL=1
MGYSYRNNGGITDYWPDNDANTLYLTGENTIGEIIDQGIEHFGLTRFRLDDAEISSEYIHTSCLTYDQHDSSDYTCFTVLRLKETV